jgi:hypothetical protein
MALSEGRALVALVSWPLFGFWIVVRPPHSRSARANISLPRLTENMMTCRMHGYRCNYFFLAQIFNIISCDLCLKREEFLSRNLCPTSAINFSATDAIQVATHF